MFSFGKKSKKRKNLECLLSNYYLDLKNIKQDYQIIVSDCSIQNPFVIDAKLLGIVKKYVLPHDSEKEKAYRIFNWIVNNIGYHLPWRLKYGNSKKVLEDGEAVCADMAFLYVTMARSAGLKSHVAEVTKDVYNTKVCHACAIVKAEGKTYLADPAYKVFGVNHKKFRIISDLDATQIYAGRPKK